MPTSRSFVRFLATALLAAAGGSPAAAQPAGGDAVLLSIDGDVRVLRTSRDWTAMQPLVRGDTLRAGDTVVTGGDGRVQIRFSDGALVTLQPRSRFRIDEYRFDDKGQRSFMTLLRGALRTTSGTIGKRSHEDYRLRTPTATVGIRGTDYSAEETVCDPQCSPGPSPGLRVSVTQGRIAVTSQGGTIEVPAGASAHVSAPQRAPQLNGTGPRPVPRVDPPPGPSRPSAPSAPAQPEPPAAPQPVLPPAPSPDRRAPGTEAHGPPRPAGSQATWAPDAPDRSLAGPVLRDPVAWTAGTPAGQDEHAVESIGPARTADASSAARPRLARP